MDYPNSNEKNIKNKNDDFLVGYNLREDNILQQYTLDGGYYNKLLRSPFYYHNFDTNLISPIYNDTKPQPFKLNMFNYWYNYNRCFINPEVRYFNGMVLIQGIVNAGKDETIGFLQELYRPLNRLILNCNNHDNIARVDIDIDGRILWIGGTKNYGWISLSGILYIPIHNEKTNSKPIKLDMSISIKEKIGYHNNKYMSFGHDPNYELYNTPIISSIDGIVILQGLVRKLNREDNFGNIGVIQKEYISGKKMIFNCNSHENTARVDIDENGKIVWKDGLEENVNNRLDIDNLLSLTGIFYSIKDNQFISLINGWENFSDSYLPATYRLYNNIVIIQGTLKNNINSDIITILPISLRPKGRLVFGTNQNKSSCRIDIFPDGSVKIINRDTKISWISLNGIVYNL